MGFFGLEISKRAIMTHQAALLVTGHNIANADTDGYSRQVAKLVTNIPWYTPSLTSASNVGQLGTGVNVASINRIRDQFLDNQLRSETRIQTYWSNMEETLGLIETVINEPSNEGLRSMMDAYWAAWQDVSNSPEDESTRTVLVQTAQSMADTFNQTYDQLVAVRRSLNDTVAVKLEEINSIAKQIADLNQQILAVTVSGQQPNDLMDKRDLLLDQLSQLGNITVTNIEQTVERSYTRMGTANAEASAGLIAVQMGGRTLVQGVDHITLSTVKDDEGMYMPVWEDTGVRAVFSGGELGSLLDARGKTNLEGEPSPYKEVVPTMISDLNSLAKTVIVKTNELHRGGYSINNKSYDTAAYPDGSNFFSEPDDWQELNGRWAQYMAVESALIDDPKNVAAAQNRTWDGVQGNMVQINYGDGNVALAIAQLKHSLNAQTNILNNVRVDVHSQDPLEFSFNKNGQLVTIGIDAPYTYDEDLGKVATAIQAALDAEGLPVKVRCDGNDILFYSETLEEIEYINPDSGIIDIAGSKLQDASYTIATDTGQPGAHGAQLNLVQNYLQGSAANIFGSGVIGAITAGDSKNASIELTVDSVNTASGIVRYSYVSHEYDRDTGEHTNVSGVFEIEYGGAAAQTVNMGSLTFQLTNLNTTAAADAAELQAGDTGVLNLVASTAAGTNYNQLGITYNNDGEDDFTQKWVFADGVLDGTGTEFRRLEFFTLDDQASSSAYGTSYDGHLDLKIKSLGTASTAAFFSYYQGPELADDHVLDSTSGIRQARAAGLAIGEYEVATEVSEPGAGLASLRLMRNAIQGEAPDILAGGAIGTVNAGTDLNASMEIKIESIAAGVVSYSYVSHEYNRDNGEYAEHTGSFQLTFGAGAQNVDIGSINVTITAPAAAAAADLTVGDTAVLNQTAATLAATTYQQLQIGYNSAEEAEMIQDFVFAAGVLDNNPQVRMRFFTMNSGIAYDGYIDLQTQTLATCDPALYINYQQQDALDIVQKRSINPASGIEDIQASNLQSGDYQVITSDVAAPSAASLSIQQNYNQGSAQNILGSASLDWITIAPNNINASVQLEVTGVDIVTGVVSYAYSAHMYDKTGAYTEASGNFTLEYQGAASQNITIGGITISNITGLNLKLRADAREMRVGDKGVLNLSAVQAAGDDMAGIIFNEGAASQAVHNFVFNNGALNNATTELQFHTLGGRSVYSGSLTLGMGTFAPADPAARLRVEAEFSEIINDASGILNFSARSMAEAEYMVNTDAAHVLAAGPSIDLQGQYLRGTSNFILGSDPAGWGALVGADDLNASLQVEVISVDKNTGEVRYKYKIRELEASTGNYAEHSGDFSLGFGGADPQTITVGSISIPITGLNALSKDDALSMTIGDRGVFDISPAAGAYDLVEVVQNPGSTDEIVRSFYFDDGVLNNLSGKELSYFSIDDEKGGLYGPVITIDTGADIADASPALHFVFRNVSRYEPDTEPVDRDVALLENVTLDDFWAGVASDVGVQSQQAQRMVANQEILVTELNNQRAAVSGVSLDEEMTSMIQFQHSYNAAARMLTAVDEMLDVIINRLGRVGL